jgi:phage shock protein C
MKNRKLFRNTYYKMLGGVASGLADFLEVDVTIIRIAFALGIFLPIPFCMVIVYIILWILMPDIKNKPKELEEAQHEHK